MTNDTDKPGFDRKMTRDEINELEIQRYEGKIHLIHSLCDLKECIDDLKQEDVLGFDTETRPAFKKGESYPVSLIQLATRSSVYIFQLTPLSFVNELVDLMANPSIKKVGAGLDYDLIKLKELKEFKPAQFVDLGDLARERGIMNHGLRGLTAALLDFRISKQAQRSNWANPNLTSAQLRYAATDAWVSRLLYFELMKYEPVKRKQKSNDCHHPREASRPAAV